MACLLGKEVNKMLWASWRKGNELLFSILEFLEGLPGSSRICASYWVYGFVGVPSQRQKTFLFLGMCFEECSYASLTCSSVPFGHVLMFRFLFTKHVLSTYLCLKRIKSGNNIIKITMFYVNYLIVF